MQKISIVVDVQGKIFKSREDKKKLFWKSPQANPKLNPRVRVGVNSWENKKR